VFVVSLFTSEVAMTNTNTKKKSHNKLEVEEEEEETDDGTMEEGVDEEQPDLRRSGSRNSDFIRSVIYSLFN